MFPGPEGIHGKGNIGLPRFPGFVRPKLTDVGLVFRNDSVWGGEGPQVAGRGRGSFHRVWKQE